MQSPGAQSGDHRSDILQDVVAVTSVKLPKTLLMMRIESRIIFTPFTLLQITEDSFHTGPQGRISAGTGPLLLLSQAGNAPWRLVGPDERRSHRWGTFRDKPDPVKSGDNRNVNIRCQILRHNFNFRFFKSFQDVDDEPVPGFVFQEERIIKIVRIPGDTPGVPFNQFRKAVNDRFFVGIARGNPIGMRAE